MELAPRVLSLLPVLTSAADIYAAMACMAGVPEEQHLAHLFKQARSWADLVVKRTEGNGSFVVRRLATGLLYTAICDRIRAAIPPPYPPLTFQHRRWNRRAVLFGAMGQRALGNGLQLLVSEDQSALIRACTARQGFSWAAAALVGARSANVVEQALKQAFRQARVVPASMEEDAMEATDFVLAWPCVSGGFLIQVKTASQRDEPIRVLVYNHSSPHRHQFLMAEGSAPRAEEARQIGNRQYLEACQVWRHAQTRWGRTKEPWFAAFVTVHADLPDSLSAVLVHTLAQHFSPPTL